MPSRPRTIRIHVAALLACILATAVLPAVQASAPSTLGQAVLANAFAPHEDALAWMQRDGTGLKVQLANLTDGSVRTLSAITASRASVQVKGFSFDGRWVAWCDDRFGNFDAFAADARTGTLVRLSQAGADDTSIQVDGGVAAWERQGSIQLHDLRNGTAWELDSGPGLAFEPAITQGSVAWIRASNGTRAVLAKDLTGGATRVLFDKVGQFPHGLVATAGQVAWASQVLRDAVRTQEGIARVAIDVAPVAGGAARELAWDSPGLPAAGSGRIAWTDYDVEHDLVARAVPSGGGPAWSAPVTGVHLGAARDQLVVFTGPDDAGSLALIPWQETATSVVPTVLAWSAAILGTLAVVGILVWVWRRRAPT